MRRPSEDVPSLRDSDRKLEEMSASGRGPAFCLAKAMTSEFSGVDNKKKSPKSQILLSCVKDVNKVRAAVTDGQTDTQTDSRTRRF